MPKLFILCLLSFFCLGLFILPSCPADGDTGLQITNGVKGKLNDNWSLCVAEDTYFGDDAKDFYYHHTDIGLGYLKTPKWLGLGLNYRIIHSRGASGWSVEHRPHFNVTIKWDLWQCSLANLVRTEYRLKAKGNDSWRMRDCFSVTLPIKFTKFEFQPYLSDDMFYPLDSGQLNYNEAVIGFKYKPAAKISGIIGYVRKDSKVTRSHWDTMHCLLLVLIYSF